MNRRIFQSFFIAAWLANAPAMAATVDVVITGTDGRPAADAVTELFMQDQTGASPAQSQLPSDAVVDQRNEMFIPLVSVIRRGGHVMFTNNDNTMHQVYSFSSIKQFAFEIDEGKRSAPVTFDQPGVAAIGCNIHDQMVTFVYVAETPWVARADDKGHAEITNVPVGDYRVSVWDPQLMPGYHPSAAMLRVPDEGAKLSLSIPLLSNNMQGMKHMHTSY
jgi:plastocyanin